MTRILTAAAMVLALSAPDIVHACDINTYPVSDDEVIAAGLGPLLDQAGKQLADEMEPLKEQLEHPMTKQEEDTVEAAVVQVQEAFSNRMVILAKRARCGTAE